MANEILIVGLRVAQNDIVKADLEYGEMVHEYLLQHDQALNKADLHEMLSVIWDGAKATAEVDDMEIREALADMLCRVVALAEAKGITLVDLYTDIIAKSMPSNAVDATERS